VLNLKGKHIEFSTNQLKQSVRLTSAEKDKIVDTITGGFVEFNTTVSKKDTLQQATTLSGSNIESNISNIGSWSWVERKPSVCMICKLPLKSTHTINRCPMCQTLFHADHIFEWLKVKGKCPVCLQNLRPGGTEEVKLQ
jgi:hypothetical protein